MPPLRLEPTHTPRALVAGDRLRRKAQTLGSALHAPQVGRQLRARDRDRLSALGTHLQGRLRHGRAPEIVRRLCVMLPVLKRPVAKAKPVAATLRKRMCKSQPMRWYPHRASNTLRIR